MNYYAGIDLGGTFVKGGIVDEEGNILVKDKIPTGKERPYAEIAADMAQLVLDLAKKAGISPADVKAAGVGSPGTIDSKNGVIVYSNNIRWEKVPLGAELKKHLGIPVFATNDANAAALGESFAGAAKSYPSSVFITLGTGVGGAYFDGGKVVFGEDFRYGRFGHLVMRDNGKLCGCGQCGCIESYISATALTKLCAAAGTAPEKVFYEERRESRAVVNEWLDALCEAMETVFRAQKYDLMIFGGGVCASAERWLPLLGAKTERRAEVSKLGNSGGLTGAYLWWCENG